MATPTPAGLLPRHWAELQASAIAPDVAALNVAAFGPGTDRHWESERAELVAHARLQIQTESRAGNGHPQGQAGFLADRLIRLDSRYRHLQAGGWRSLSDALPGLDPFDQWKPNQGRGKGRRDAAGRWQPLPGQTIKYEAQPQHPAGGGLLLPQVPLRCWERICERQSLPLPDPATVAAGFWPWALATPGLQLLICEGWKKALAAVSAGWAAVALPGVEMGRRRVKADGSERLIEALQLLAAPQQLLGSQKNLLIAERIWALAMATAGTNRLLFLGDRRGRITAAKPCRPWLIAFDAEAKTSTARKVGAAAGALARALRSAGGRVEIARLPLLPGTEKTGLDDLLAAAGPEALDRALADTGPRAVLPWLRPADHIAPAGQWLGVACPLPSPELAPLLILRASMGCGKTEATAQALAPLAAEGVPVLMPSHRKALGQAAAERVGVPWCPSPGTDERLQGVAGCLDSWCSSSALEISPSGWSGGVLVLDEWMQQIQHLLLSTGTALVDRPGRRAAVLRTLAEQLPRMRQVIAADAQMADWGVQLLERLTGRSALVIASKHRPMAGRALHCPEGFATAAATALAFRAKWAELVEAGAPFLCGTSAQQAGMCNAPQTLANLHRLRRPDARLLVIDSSTPEAAAELAADPDGVAERFDAIYCSPSISSGISFQRWKPAAVLVLAGGRIAPEHAAQVAARVRSPEVPAWVFAPERCPGSALKVGSGSTDPAALIASLRAVANPLLGVLEDAGDAWLQAWAELGARRNRQHYAYRATIAGLLEAEGWQLQAPGPAPCPVAAAIATAELQEIAAAALDAEDAAVIAAPLLDAEAAAALQRRRQRTPEERIALQRHRLAERWALGTAAPSLELLEADRDGLRDRLRLGWLLTTPEALALIPGHDQQRIAALDPTGRPFAPDRLRVTLGPKVAALIALGLPQLLARFSAGEVIAANDPAVMQLHTTATAHRAQLVAATGWSPAKLATGTLRTLLRACGWQLQRAGRIKARGAGRDALTYRAQLMALPEGVDAQALAAAWLAELQAAASGALFAPTGGFCRGRKCPTPPASTPPLPHRPLSWGRVAPIPWTAAIRAYESVPLAA